MAALFFQSIVKIKPHVIQTYSPNNSYWLLRIFWLRFHIHYFSEKLDIFLFDPFHDEIQSNYSSNPKEFFNLSDILYPYRIRCLQPAQSNNVEKLIFFYLCAKNGKIWETDTKFYNKMRDSSSYLGHLWTNVHCKIICSH